MTETSKLTAPSASRRNRSWPHSSVQRTGLLAPSRSSRFTPWRLASVAALLMALVLAACGDRQEHPRCARCGMRVDTAPAWLAGHGTARFDGAKCLFRWAADANAGLEDAWVTDYYGADRLPARDAHFVIGSDVLSPMGDDLVPLRTAAEAARFASDHGGRLVRAGDVDAALLDGLDGR